MANPVEQKLYDAIRYGRVGEALSLLKNNPVINVNWKNPDHSQWSGLHAASFYGHAEVVKLLLAHPNIDVNMKNISGQTPFSIGCWQGRVTVVRVLLKDPVSTLHLMTTIGALHCGMHLVMESMKSLSGSLQVADIWEIS